MRPWLGEFLDWADGACRKTGDPGLARRIIDIRFRGVSDRAEWLVRAELLRATHMMIQNPVAAAVATHAEHLCTMYAWYDDLPVAEWEQLFADVLCLNRLLSDGFLAPVELALSKQHTAVTMAAMWVTSGNAEAKQRLLRNILAILEQERNMV